MAVLVTGATGFVGSWLVRGLNAEGEEVRVLHRPSSSLEDLKGAHFTSCLGDVTDLPSLKQACRDVDTVFHLAGLIGYSRAMRPAMEQVNVEGTRNVLRAMRENSVPQLIYMSSVVAVGANALPQPLNEDSPYSIAHLNLGYFETKHHAEKLVVAAARAKEVERTIILNPSTIYGAGDAKKGSRKTQVKVAHGRFPFYTSGGPSIVSVHDVVQAILAARTKGRNGERYILSGENMTIQDLFQRLARFGKVAPPGIYLPNWLVHSLGKLGDALEVLGQKGPLNSETAWTSTLFHWFDHSKAKRELDFHPRPADQALSESVEWMKQNGYLG